MKSLIHSIADRLARKGFARSVGLLLGGAVIAQGLMLLCSPFIARLYSPQDYGVLGIYMSTLGIVSPVAMLRYESAIPGCTEDRRAAHLVLLSVAVSGVTSLGCWLLIAGLAALKISVMGAFVAYAWILPIGMLGTAVYQALSYWAIRRGHFRLLGQTKATQGIAMAGAQMGLGLLRVGAIGLLVGHFLGQTGGIGSLFTRIRQQDRNQFSGATARDLILVAREYQRFPKYSVGATLIESLSNNLPLLFVAGQYDVVVAGWLTLVQRTVALPLAMFSTNVSQVYFHELADLRRTTPGAMLALFDRRLKQLSLAGGAAGVILGVAAPFLIPLLFGARWRPAVLCLELLLPSIVSSFIANPFGATVDVLERQDMHLLRDIIRGLIMAAALTTTFALNLDWRGAVAFITVGGFLGNVTYVVICRLAIQRQVLELKHP